MPEPDPANPLSAEARITYGPVPRNLGGVEVPPGHSKLTEDSYLLHTDSGYAYRYRKGEGVTIERAPGADPAEESLWLNGSVYAAIACLNGYLPIHASAVAHEGRVYAFTGPSGAGKSTLAAGLGAAGLPLFADDTLVLDLSDPHAIRCLPGHKRLKLTDAALALSGARPEEDVGAGVAKRYATPRGGTVRAILPLAELVLLEDGDPPRIEPVTGAARIALLNDDHYTAGLYATAHRLDPAARFAWIAALAPRIETARFVRPRDPARFAETTTLAVRHIIGRTAA